MRKRLGFIFVMVLLVGLVISPAYAQTPRIGLIFAEGGFGINPLMMQRLRLMQAQDELGVDVTYVEPADIAEMEEHRAYADLDLDLVIVIGFITRAPWLRFPQIIPTSISPLSMTWWTARM